MASKHIFPRKTLLNPPKSAVHGAQMTVEKDARVLASKFRWRGLFRLP